MIFKWELIKAKFAFLRSLKVRIFLWLILAGIIPSMLMRYGILENYENRAVSVRTSEVQTQLKIIANHLITYNYLQDTSSPVINAELEQLSNLYDGRVLIIGNNLKVIKDTYGISEGKTMISEEVVKCFLGESMSGYDEELGYIEFAIPISPTISSENTTEDGTDAVQGVMLVSISNDTILKTMEILHSKAGTMQILMLVVIMGIAYLISVWMVRPFHKVTESIRDVSLGYKDDLIDVKDYEETVHIVDSFNQLLSRMRILDNSRQEFVSNVSHELKTPITSMKVLADSLLMQEDVPAELYREFMEDIATEIDRENKIITDLLALVKMDKTASELNIAEISMNELAEVVLKRLRPIARKQDIEVTFESVRPVKASVDEVKMSLIISNLVENAIKYNREHGWVRVTLDADHQFFVLTISDSGMGIPEEALEQIYERFYRVDKSHSREIGGTGLGLAITRTAVLMHRGSIQVQSEVGSGTTFTVKIPLTYKG